MRVTKGPALTMAGESYDSEVARASLRRIVLETALWSNGRANLLDPILCLRSAKLAPHLFEPSRHETVFDVIEKRHNALVATARLPHLGRWDELVDAAAAGLAGVRLGGGLLAWERDRTLDDGFGEVVTNGYLDASDLPPWDTWIAYVEQVHGTAEPRSPYRENQRESVSCLVAWVPDVFVPAVTRAVENHSTGALYWLRDSKLPIAEVLRADGLLA